MVWWKSPRLICQRYHALVKRPRIGPGIERLGELIRKIMKRITRIAKAMKINSGSEIEESMMVEIQSPYANKMAW